MKQAAVLAAVGALLSFPLQAQNAARPGDAAPAELPRFRQLQVRIEAPATSLVLPGRWLAAAAAMGETAQAMRTAYTELTLRAELGPLPPDSVTRFGLLRVMGLFRRDELTRASIATLTRLRANLQSDTALARFGYLFQPGGRWQVDVHDVALARARRPFPTISWEAARGVLASAGLIETGLADIEAIPLAVYRLYAQSETDTSAFQSALQRLRQLDPSGAAAVQSLIAGYEEAALWYVSALRFLLEERWISTEAGMRSPLSLVRDHWGSPVSFPELRSRIYGYPEGTVRIGTDSSIVSALVIPENLAGREWIARHGPGELLATLHRLVLPSGEQTRLKVGSDLYRLSSVEEYARESFSGFLEPADLILLDPSYQPLLALGTLVHEWQHILAEHARQADRSGGAFRVSGEQLVYLPLDPYLAEGFAEWLTEVILAPALAEFPLLAVGEAEKRISLPQNDPHQLGYLMVRTLARTLDPRATRQLLIAAASSPEQVTRDPRVRRAWAAYHGTDRTMGRRGEPSLLPMAIFTVEDGFPDLVQSQIIAPYIPRR